MKKDVTVVDISELQPSQGDYICPFCGVAMLPIYYSAEAISLEVQCPSCGYRLDPMTDQTKHASKLTPKITEELIADEEEEGGSNIFEVVDDEDPSRAADDEEINDFTEDDKRDEESLTRQG